ncbi:MAG: PAS domain S-box protein [Armatimonadetes bacterium]|nr:PAS domain S-box protein [Armatimonadota bacterium]
MDVWNEVAFVLDWAGIVRAASLEPATAADWAAQTVGMAAAEIVHADDRPRFAQALAQATTLPTQLDLRLVAGAQPVVASVAMIPGALAHVSVVCRPTEVCGYHDGVSSQAAGGALYGRPSTSGESTGQTRGQTLLGELASVEVLDAVVHEIATMAGSSVWAFEGDGSFVAGCHGGRWCQWLDQTSFESAGGRAQDALRSGRWICHECRWHGAVMPVLTTGRAADTVCAGGVAIHAVPILTDRGVVGALCGSVSDPPSDIASLHLVAERYGVDPGLLLGVADQHPRRPAYLFGLVRERLRSSARMLGLLVGRGVEQRRLAQAERKLAAAFRNVPDAVIITTLEDGMVVDCSDSFTAVSGYARSEVIGKTSYDLRLWSSPAQREAVVQELRRHGRVVGREADFRLASGQIRRSRANFEVVNLDGTMCVMTVVSMID